MIVTASDGECVLDFEDQFFSFLRYNEVLSAVNSIRIFLGHAHVAACAFSEDKMVPGCFEAARKFKRLEDPERAILWYGVSMRSREFLFGTYVISLRTGEVAARYLSVDEYIS